MNPHGFLHTHLKRTCLPFHHFGILLFLIYNAYLSTVYMHSVAEIDSRSTLSENLTFSQLSPLAFDKSIRLLSNSTKNSTFSTIFLLASRVLGRVPLRHINIFNLQYLFYYKYFTVQNTWIYQKFSRLCNSCS